MLIVVLTVSITPSPIFSAELETLNPEKGTVGICIAVPPLSARDSMPTWQGLGFGGLGFGGVPTT